MNEQTIGQFLDDLASSAPAPGGGAAAALTLATGAALVAMVCNLTVGREKFRAHEDEVRAALDEAERLRAQALSLAAEDADAFGHVSQAYGLPRTTDEEKAARSARIQEALRGAADPPLRTALLAARTIEICAAVAPIGNPNVISDVGVAALCARAALDGAALNVEVNLGLIRDESFKADTRARLEPAVAAAHRQIEQIMTTVEAGIKR